MAYGYYMQSLHYLRLATDPENEETKASFVPSTHCVGNFYCEDQWGYMADPHQSESHFIAYQYAIT